MKLTDVLLRDGERVDDTGFGGYSLIQGGGFRYGVDAVLLAAFAAGETGACAIRSHAGASSVNAADLGSGNGIIPIVLAHKLPNAEITGIEINAEEFDRACRSVRMNGLSDRVQMLNMDIRELHGDLRQGGDGAADIIPAGGCDAVVTNPPYFKRGSALTNRQSAKAGARHEITAELGDFLAAAERLLVRGGDFYMVHRPGRLVDILTGMRAAGLEPKELQLVTPRPGSAANLLLVHGVKGAAAELRMLPELPVHSGDGGYSLEIERLYERR